MCLLGMRICMSWNSIDFDWNRARAFLVTAEEGSLTAAAKALGMTQPTLGRQVTALEEELGVTLFERVPQGLVLTESGVELIGFVRAMGEAASQLSINASGQSQRIEGPVCISATEIDAIHFLPPIMELLRAQEPGIDIEIVVSNDVTNLKRREADIALRNFRPSQPDLIVKKLREENVWLYAAPKYLAKLGNQENVAQMTHLDIVGYERSESNIQLLKKMGFPVSLENISIVTQSYLLQWELVKQGLGVGFFSQAKGDAEPSLVKVFEQLGPIAQVPIWLVCHRELHTSLRVRRVFDLLASQIQEN